MVWYWFLMFTIMHISHEKTFKKQGGDLLLNTTLKNHFQGLHLPNPDSQKLLFMLPLSTNMGDSVGLACMVNSWLLMCSPMQHGHERARMRARSKTLGRAWTFTTLQCQPTQLEKYENKTQVM